MANDDNEDRGLDALRRSEQPDEKRAAREALEEGRTVGEGMTSPDSTQVPLSAETGKPDPRARSGERNASNR